MATPQFKELVHFIVNECTHQSRTLGAIRLNKTLWYTDVLAYQETGKSVTGEKYIKRKMGPVPAAILTTIGELQTDGDISTSEPEFQYDVRKYVSLKAPVHVLLTEAERDRARAVLDMVCGHTATAISEITHDIVWAAAADGEEIPLYATLVSELAEIDSDVREWAKPIVAELEAA